MSRMLVAPLLHLRTAPAFEGLGQPYLHALARESEEVLLPRGTVVLSMTEPAKALHVVVDGMLGGSGSGQALRFGAGDVVGFLEVLAGSPGAYQVSAETDTVALRLDGEVLRDLLERHMPLLVHFLAEVAARTLVVPEATAVAIRGGEPPRPLPAGMDRVRRIIALHRSPAFPSGNMDALAELAGHVREVNWAEGAQLWQSGAAAASFHVVCSGSVTWRGADQRVDVIGPGGVPGFLDVFGGGPRSGSAEASTPTVTLEVDRESFLDVLEDHFEMAWTVLANLSRALQNAEGE